MVAVPWGSADTADGPGVRMPWQRGRACDASLSMPWSRSTRCDVVVPVPWGATTRRGRGNDHVEIVWPIEPDAVYQIPVRDAYMTLHDVHILLLPDRTELPFTGLTIIEGADAWSRQLTATVVGQAALDAIVAVDSPVIEVIVNGYLMEFMLEDWQQSERFGGKALTINGRSRTAALAVPYVIPRDLTSTADRTMQQHALAELPLSDWTLSWSAADWVVDAGAWSYQGYSPVGALGLLASGAGAVLLSEMTGQGFIVQPYYRHMPWEFELAASDYVVPMASVTAIARQSQPAGEANAVYAMGGDQGGLLGHITRTGTAGDRELELVTNDLMTDAIGLRALGEKLLADAAPQPAISSVTLPLSTPAGDHPLPKIGDLIAVAQSSGDIKGICTRIEINVVVEGRDVKVRQTLSLGSAGYNPWARFSALTAGPPLLVGTVIATSATSATVQMIGGGIMTAKGTASVTDTVYIRGGIIEGTAPSLTAIDIQI